MGSRAVLLAVAALAVGGTTVAVAADSPPLPAGAGFTLEGKGAPQPLQVETPVAPALPPGVAPAALVPEAVLEQPAAWPQSFGDGFPRTSGTGRYLNGAFFWSDFLYDDNGALGVGPGTNESSGAPSQGTYVYPEPEAHGNGADIFRVAVGRTPGATVWRVDWNTLADRTLPAAVFAIDADADPATGLDAWPANASLSSPGTDVALVLSSTGAWVSSGGAPERVADTQVQAGSFVATVPDDALPLGSRSTVRVAAGLADEAGAGLRTLDPQHGAAPGQPNVYNVAFRDYADESPVRNAWFDTGQMSALTGGGDVTPFAVTLDWGLLDAGEDEPEPLLSGYTNRWYVSSERSLGTGIGDPPEGFDGGVVYLGAVQPYGIYVPSEYDGAPVSLTWMLHGALSNHNSAPGVSPRFLQLMCEDRRSICVSPLGRGPNGGYAGSAELDFWEVWNRVASAYALDPDRTILSGYSMGGYGTYRLAMDHPTAFAAAAPLAANAVAEDEGDIRGGTGLHRLPNLRWTPMYLWQGALDQLVPANGAVDTAAELDRLDQRYVFDLYPAEDHVVSALQDGFDDPAAFMADIDATHPREQRPRHLTYAWTSPSEYAVAHGMGARGAWWLSDVAVRDDSIAAGGLVDAASHAVQGTAIVPVRSGPTPRPDARPTPAIRQSLSWASDALPLLPQSRLVLDLTNTARLTVDVAAAGVDGDEAATISVTTDGTVDALTLTNVRRGTKVRVGNGPAVAVGRNRTVVLGPLGSGTHTITLS